MHQFKTRRGLEPTLQCYGHLRVLGIPIPQTLVMWSFPSRITLAIWVRVRFRVTGDSHITRVLGMVMPKMRGCPYHCGTDLRSANVSRIVTGDELSPASVTVPENFTKISSAHFLFPFKTLYTLRVTNINVLPTVSIHNPEIWLWEIIKWSPKRKCFDL